MSRQPQRLTKLLVGLPALLLLLAAWSAGEAVSYTCGASGPKG
jgi:hypothetical protein